MTFCSFDDYMPIIPRIWSGMSGINGN